MKVTLADPVRNGSHTIEIPTPWPELNDAVVLYRDIRAKSDQAFNNIETTRQAVEVAQRERQDKLASAVLSGGRQPQKDEVAAAQQKHAAAVELSAATAQALDMAFERVEELIERNRGDWVGSAALAEADCTAVYAEAVDAVADAREQMMVARTHSAFIRSFPLNKAGWIHDRDVIGLNGAKLPWPSVELALKREAGTARLEPSTLPEHVEALKETADAKPVAA